MGQNAHAEPFQLHAMLPAPRRNLAAKHAEVTIQQRAQQTANQKAASRKIYILCSWSLRETVGVLTWRRTAVAIDVTDFLTAQYTFVTLKPQAANKNIDARELKSIIEKWDASKRNSLRF